MIRLLLGDCRNVLQRLDDCSVQCVVTSPPYFGLRDYGVDGQIGLEPTPDEFVAAMVEVFREVRRVLKDDGTLWLNLGDSYNAAGREGHGTRIGYKQGSNRASDTGADNCRPTVSNLKPKDLIGIPWRVAFALQADGWYLRQDIIWHKPNPMPESVRDRCTKAHEYIFLMSKSERYFYDSKTIAEASTEFQKTPYRARVDTGIRKGSSPVKVDAVNQCGVKETRNKRSVWTIAPKPFKEAHFATFPPDIPEICIKAGSREGDTILDPFGGAGTTGLVADRLRRNAVLIELNPNYAEITKRRMPGADIVEEWEFA